MAIYLRLRCQDSAENKFAMTYPCVNTAVDPELVDDFAEEVILKKTIFARQPEKILGAEFVVNSTIEIPGVGAPD